MHRPVRVLIAGAWCSLALLAGALHLSTYFGFDPMTRLPELWVLHAAAMGALASTVLSGNIRVLRRGSNVFDLLDDGSGGDGAPDRAVASDDEFARRVRPNRRKLIAGALGAYAIANFFICLSILQGGQPIERGGQHLLQSHGKVVATLTEGQYHWDLAVQTRLATGHWVFAFYLSGVLWSVAHGRRGAAESDPVTD